MSRNYDLSRKSDVNRLCRDIEKEGMRMAKESVLRNGVEYECPSCGTVMQVRNGLNTCPNCGGQIDVVLDLSHFG